MQKDSSFLGQGWAFPPGFSLESQTVVLVREGEDIQQSLILLLSTQLGERVMQPRYGCNLRNAAFEKADKTTLTYLRDTIETAIIYHEPRIRLVEVNAVVGTGPEGKITFDIVYLIRSTNTRSNLVYPHYLTEATDLFL